METYVVGTIDRETAMKGHIDGIIERLSPVGYQFAEDRGAYSFVKGGRVESVITEMVPVCEDHGLDVEAFNLVEYRRSDDQIRSRYEGGRILRV